MSSPLHPSRGVARLACAVTALAALLALPPVPGRAQTISSRSWSTPYPGVRLLEGRTTSPTTRFYALFVDLCTDYVHVAATGRPSSRRSAASWGSSAGVVAATNGDFYRTDISTPTVYGLAVGGGSPWPVAQTGEGAAASGEWYHRRYGWIAFGPDWVEFNHTRWVKNNLSPSEGWSPSRVTPDIPSGTVALVSGFPELVTEGRRYTCASPTASSCFPDRGDMRQRHPRSAMGLTEDMQTFILLVVDGRSTVSAGMYGTELASLIHQLGAWQAYNLDGGGSSQMWLRSRGTINRPSDGSPRSVANHWGIFAGSAAGRPRAPGSCMPLSLDDCFRRQADGGRCGENEAILAGDLFTQGTTSDVDGDGLADVCARGARGLFCQPSTGDGFGMPGFRVDALSDAAGYDDPSRWSTLRMGDIDGDGLADVCVRTDVGVRCWRSTGTELAGPVEGPALTDEGSWAEPRYYSTIRMADVNGDGRDDLCARGYSGLLCWRATGEGFEEEAMEGPGWGQAAGFGEPALYGTIRMGDVDGDGRADACARTQDGMECWLSDGAGFPTRVEGPAWRDTGGWAHTKHWSTIRLADVNGDGRADLCARSASDLRCHFASAEGFTEAVTVAELSDDSGWGQHDNYGTLRTGDLDGDGALDLCIRANARIVCHRWDGSAFQRIDGPELSDASGWDDPMFYGSLRLADVTGDGRADLCARASAAFHCWPSMGDGFGEAITLEALTDARGWSDPRYYGTIRMAGPRCAPAAETCNGTDDDCDGEVDEGACLADGGIPPTGDAGIPSGGADGGHGEGGVTAEDPEMVGGGCGCSSGGPTEGAPIGLALLLLLLGPRLRAWRPSRRR